MPEPIALAGATGNLGTRIAAALGSRGAKVRALVRPGTAAEKIAKLREGGAEIAEVDYADRDALTRALAGSAAVVSALQGLEDVIVGTQTQLLEAAVDAGVPRFIPSDYAADFTKLRPEENRNFALRQTFRGRLLASPVQSTSVLNGMFMDLLLWGTPLLDLKAGTVSYWGEPDQLLDFTTMDDTAAFTAAAAMDTEAPEILRIAGDQVTAADLAQIAGEMTGREFRLVKAGSLDALAEQIETTRAAHPEQEAEEFPPFQQMQYIHNMQSGRAKLSPIDDARYPGLRWTTVRDLLTAAGRR